MPERFYMYYSELQGGNRWRKQVSGIWCFPHIEKGSSTKKVFDVLANIFTGQIESKAGKALSLYVADLGLIPGTAGSLPSIARSDPGAQSQE